MERMTDIFDQDILSESSSGDLDQDLANAGHVLQKLAEEEGVDLNSLSDADVAALAMELLPTQGHAQTTQETRKEASAMSTETETQTQIPNEPTYADVAVELSKIAAAEGIDLATVSREEYHEAFAKVAEMMADPTYGEKVAEEEEKLAAAYAQGVRMADGFLDRLKEAEDEDEKKKDEKKDDDEGKKEAARAVGAAIHHAKDKAKKLLGKGVGAAVRAGEKVREGASAAAKAERGFHEGVGKGHAKGLSMAIAKRSKGTPAERLATGRTMAGRAVTGGAAAGAAGAAGAGYAAGRSKESFDLAALEVAQDIARDMGFDPTTGEKLAGDEVLDADAVAERAIELLKEAGYLPQE